MTVIRNTHTHPVFPNEGKPIHTAVISALNHSLVTHDCSQIFSLAKTTEGIAAIKELIPSFLMLAFINENIPHAQDLFFIIQKLKIEDILPEIKFDGSKVLKGKNLVEPEIGNLLHYAVATNPELLDMTLKAWPKDTEHQLISTHQSEGKAELLPAHWLAFNRKDIKVIIATIKILANHGTNFLRRNIDGLNALDLVILNLNFNAVGAFLVIKSIQDRIANTISEKHLLTIINRNKIVFPELSLRTCYQWCAPLSSEDKLIQFGDSYWEHSPLNSLELSEKLRLSREDLLNTMVLDIYSSHALDIGFHFNLDDDENDEEDEFWLGPATALHVAALLGLVKTVLSLLSLRPLWINHPLENDYFNNSGEFYEGLTPLFNVLCFIQEKNHFLIVIDLLLETCEKNKTAANVKAQIKLIQQKKLTLTELSPLLKIASVLVRQGATLVIDTPIPDYGDEKGYAFSEAQIKNHVMRAAHFELDDKQKLLTAISKNTNTSCISNILTPAESFHRPNLDISPYLAPLLLNVARIYNWVEAVETKKIAHANDPSFEHVSSAYRLYTTPNQHSFFKKYLRRQSAIDIYTLALIRVHMSQQKGGYNFNTLLNIASFLPWHDDENQQPHFMKWIEAHRGEIVALADRIESKRNEATRSAKKSRIEQRTIKLSR